VRIAVLCADLGVRVPGDKGASLHLQAITTAFARVGHQVLLVGVAGHGAPRLPADVETILLPHPGRADGLRRELRKLRFTAALPDRVRARLRSFAPDVFYERLSLFGTAGTTLADELGVPHVLEINALLAREDAAWRGLRLGALARRREAAVLNAADLRVVVSGEVGQAVQAVTHGKDVLVVPNGVDREAFAHLPSRAQARQMFDLDDQMSWCGFSGALRPWHGVTHAIDALLDLPAGIGLAVAGDGPVRDDLVRHAGRLGVADRVRWLGQLPHNQMPAFLAAVDVALAPYPAALDFSFSPLKVYEYLAAGVPTVASDIGQLQSLLAELPGATLVPPGDPVAIATAVHAILANHSMWQAAAAGTRRTVLRDHSWECRARQICNAMEQLDGRALAA
jgi:glycosyltransferase involved in cell wall biosynthesis